MEELKREYTDVRSRTHQVEHAVVPDNKDGSREQIIEELIRLLTKPEKSG